MRYASEVQKSVVDDSVLVVIDFQNCFHNTYYRAKSQTLIGKVARLLRVAKHLDVPVVAMAKDNERSGNLNQRIQNALPNGTKIHHKEFFGLAGNSEILSEVKATGLRG